MTTTPPTPGRPTGSTGRPAGHKRDLTLLWAIVTFAALVLGSALLLLVLAGGGQLPVLEQGPSWTPPAVVAPTPASVAAEVQRSDKQPYLPGDVLQNVSGGRVNLRQTPGFQSKSAEDVIAVLQAGEMATVLAGPEQADGLRWWRVSFNEIEGWMAERSNSGKVLLGPAP